MKKLLKKDTIIATCFLLVMVISSFLYFFPPSYWMSQQLINKARIVTIKKDTIFNDEEPLDPTTTNLWQAQFQDIGQSGYVVIPSSSISLPIFEGIGGYNMLYGAGEQLPRTEVKPGGNGNYILASHYIVGHNTQHMLFTNLVNSKVQDTVWVADSENVYVYRIDEVFETHVSDNSSLRQPDDSSKQLITLYTCTDLNSVYRYVVTGHLESTVPINEVSLDTYEAMSPWLSKFKN